MRDENNFDLDEALWEQYLEWCDQLVVKYYKDGMAYLEKRGATPSVPDFAIWLQENKYYLDKIEDD